MERAQIVEPLNQMNKSAVIIGGGLGGLATALRLAASGWRVTVCEQGASFGGKMNSWCARGFRFDTGPSLITMPWVFEDLFKVAGVRMQDHIELVQMRPLADYIFADGVRFSYSASMPEWLDTIRELEPGDVDGFFKFMELGARLYEISKETFLRKRPFDPPDKRSLAAIRHMPLRYGWGNYHRTVAAHFKSRHLRQLYDRYPTYVGSSPYESPATLAVIPYIEYAFGGWYVKGGLYRIVASLIELAARAGVALLLNAAVERVTREGEKATGVRLASGAHLPADVVVMNGDASAVSSLLADEKGFDLRLRERSLSGLVFLLGIKRRLPELAQHSIYFSSDYEREFQELFNERVFPSDPTVYVNAPSRSDRSLVEGEGETLFVMANAPADDETWDEEKITIARRRVFERLSRSGCPEIESDIVVSDTWTPNTIRARYMMPGGAIYGTHSHGWRRAFLRPPNKDARLRGLYYVGGSTHPGGGTPTVLLSAQITCELINRFE